jgi:hypothetical protein
MKQCMYVEVRPRMCGDSRWEMLSLISGLFCVGFINPIGVVARWCAETDTSFLSRAHPS